MLRLSRVGGAVNVSHRACGLTDVELSQAVLDVNSVWEQVAPGIEALFGFARFAAFVSPFSGGSLGVDYEIVRCDQCFTPLYGRGLRAASSKVMVLPVGMRSRFGPPVSLTAGYMRFCFCSNRCAARAIELSDEDEFRKGYPLSW